MGDKQARKLERGMGKPLGWIDVDRTLAKDWKEADMLDKLRLLSPEQRSVVSDVVNQLLHSSGDR
jgi:hypothetical protein